jgi:hypothetical protein
MDWILLASTLCLPSNHTFFQFKFIRDLSYYLILTADIAMNLENGRRSTTIETRQIKINNKLTTLILAVELNYKFYMLQKKNNILTFKVLFTNYIVPLLMIIISSPFTIIKMI